MSVHPGALPFPTQEILLEQGAAAWYGFDSQVSVLVARKQMAAVASRWRWARQLPHGRQFFGGSAGAGRVQQEWVAATRQWPWHRRCKTKLKT